MWFNYLAKNNDIIGYVPMMNVYANSFSGPTTEWAAENQWVKDGNVYHKIERDVEYTLIKMINH